VERVKGIEPSLFAWEAKVLPLNDTRMVLTWIVFYLHANKVFFKALQ
jgi:hypothetical protein